MVLRVDTQNVSATVPSGGNQSIPLRSEVLMPAHVLTIDDDQAILDLYKPFDLDEFLHLVKKMVTPQLYE